MDTRDEGFSELLGKTMSCLVNKNKEPLFLCIGTDRATGDALGPLIGRDLKRYGFQVAGTLDYPVHAVNLCDTVKKLEKISCSRELIAIDACLGRHVGCVSLWQGGVTPGSGIHKILPEVGDIALTGTVAPYSFNGMEVLQSVRLAMVAQMAEKIVKGIRQAYL